MAIIGQANHDSLRLRGHMVVFPFVWHLPEDPLFIFPENMFSDGATLNTPGVAAPRKAIKGYLPDGVHQKRPSFSSASGISTNPMPQLQYFKTDQTINHRLGK